MHRQKQCMWELGITKSKAVCGHCVTMSKPPALQALTGSVLPTPNFRAPSILSRSKTWPETILTETHSVQGRSPSPAQPGPVSLCGKIMLMRMASCATLCHGCLFLLNCHAGGSCPWTLASHFSRSRSSHATHPVYCVSSPFRGEWPFLQSSSSRREQHSCMRLMNNQHVHVVHWQYTPVA